MRIFNFLASLCSLGDLFESRFVGTHEDRSCRIEAHYCSVLQIFSDDYDQCEELTKLKQERHYKNEDYIVLSYPDTAEMVSGWGIGPS